MSDGTDTKSTTTGLKKDVLNALRVKKSQEKLIYFSYPTADNDTIHIQSSTDRLYLYLGESKGTIAKYGIDTDTSMDSNLNGDPSDDIDNKGTDSSVNGSVFAIKSTDVTTKEKTMRFNLYDANNTVIAAKDIKVVYDFVAGISTESLSGSTTEVLSKDISDSDKANLEKLKDLIKSTKEQDRLKMMQYFSQLQENWFDTREKTKTIIDFEGYLDTNAAIDAPTKESFYSLLEGFLLSETQVKDDVGLATKVLKSLIPKTNTSYTQIMKNIDDIISHPTNTALNKELGTFILNAIKDDSTIEVKDKNIIKSQLQTIIYGGQNNIPSSTVVPEASSGVSGVLDWILGLGKILIFFILGVFVVIISAFIYFKISNKDGNIGFQDFLIDKMSGKKPTPSQPIPFVTPSAPKQENVQRDVLADVVQEHPTTIPAVEIPAIQEKMTIEPSPTEATIPDWLKASTTMSAQSDEQTPAPEEYIQTPESEPVAPVSSVEST